MHAKRWGAVVCYRCGHKGIYQAELPSPWGQVGSYQAQETGGLAPAAASDQVPARKGWPRTTSRQLFIVICGYGGCLRKPVCWGRFSVGSVGCANHASGQQAQKKNIYYVGFETFNKIYAFIFTPMSFHEISIFGKMRKRREKLLTIIYWIY